MSLRYHLHSYLENLIGLRSHSLKVLLDPDRFDKKDKEKFLSLFYDNYIFWLYLPFNDPHDATRPINPEQANPQDLSTGTHAYIRTHALMRSLTRLLSDNIPSIYN